MKNDTLAKRYAKAMLDIAIEKQDQFEKIQSDLLLLKDAVESDKEFADFLGNKLVSPAQKKEVIAKAFTEIFSKEVLDFVFIVIDKNREDALVNIIDIFLQLADDHNNVALIECRSAAGLSDAEVQQIKEAFSDFLKKNIKINTTIDKSLLGGVKVYYKGRMVDGSVINKLAQYKNVLAK